MVIRIALLYVLGSFVILRADIVFMNYFDYGAE